MSITKIQSEDTIKRKVMYYQTSDGRRFRKETQANAHEFSLNYEEVDLSWQDRDLLESGGKITDIIKMWQTLVTIHGEDLILTVDQLYEDIDYTVYKRRAKPPTSAE